MHRRPEKKEARARVTSAHLIGAGIGDVDDAGRQFGLQVIDEGGFERLRLVQHVLLVETARHGQQQTEITLTLKTQHVQNYSFSILCTERPAKISVQYSKPVCVKRYNVLDF